MEFDLFDVLFCVAITIGVAGAVTYGAAFIVIFFHEHRSH